jgi:hypothetical protein
MPLYTNRVRTMLYMHRIPERSMQASRQIKIKSMMSGEKDQQRQQQQPPASILHTHANASIGFGGGGAGGSMSRRGTYT